MSVVLTVANHTFLEGGGRQQRVRVRAFAMKFNNICSQIVFIILLLVLFHILCI